MEDTGEKDLEAVARLYAQGVAAQESGDVAAAVAAFRALLSRDPQDRCGASLRLAALGAGALPPAAPPRFVETLFDENAGEFDLRLLGDLRYAVPGLIRARLAALGALPAGRMLDLGCGTGLAAAALADVTASRTGVDLSVRMLDQAAARRIYGRLARVEAVRFARDWALSGQPPFDLVVAADLLPYLGDLDPLFGAVAGCLAPGGHFAFSTERLPGKARAEPGYAVGAHTRFAHAEPYLRAALGRAGLSAAVFDRVTVRLQGNDPVPGHLVIARPGPRTGR